MPPTPYPAPQAIPPNTLIPNVVLLLLSPWVILIVIDRPLWTIRVSFAWMRLNLAGRKDDGTKTKLPNDARSLLTSISALPTDEKTLPIN